ncbi:HAD hydrolase-like protein [Streptomyces sp. NPDC051132]|uniref:HAD family hydrolase n=1 Tax=unclassified Streptomyces TaxID=2593676 RepID=UPI003418ADCC
MPIHIVWDWNGTLKDDRTDLLEAVNHTLHGLKAPPIDLRTYQAKHILPIRRFYGRLLNRPLSESEWAQAQEDFATFLHGRPARLRPGAHQLLARAHGLGHSQSVLSLYPDELLRTEVDHLGIAGFFTRIDGRRGSDGTKACVLAEHLQALAVSPARPILLIGDTLDDGVAAHAAGIHAVLHTGGLEPAQRLRSSGLPVVETLDAAVTEGINHLARPDLPSAGPLAGPPAPVRPCPPPTPAVGGSPMPCSR